MLSGAFDTHIYWDDVEARCCSTAYLLLALTVGYLHMEFATASFVQHGRIFIRFFDNVDDDFEYDGRPYRSE